MEGLFSHSIESLQESDLIELVEVRKVREHIHLDYKKDPYNHKHSGAVEMLADVTAMANAQGGYILIGVEEDQTQPDGTPKRLVGVKDGDLEVRWIEGVCLSSIDEKIPDLRVRDILLSNGLSCVIIQIPNSIRKPHMTIHENHRSFRIRHGRARSLIGMQEVRNMILSMNTYHTSLTNFITDRKKRLKDVAKGAPWLLMMTTPIYVDADKIDPLRNDIRDLLTKVPGIPDPRYEGIFVGQPKPTLFGVEANYPEMRIPQPYTKLLRLFRNGHLEYCENYISDVPKNWPQEGMPIYSDRITVTVLHFLKVARQIMQFGEVAEPIAITLHLENFNPSYLHRWGKRTPFLDEIFFWQEDALTIDFTASDLIETHNLSRFIVDRLFNAFGYDDNPHFDAEGNFVK